MSEDAPSWGALEGKTWGEIGGDVTARVPVEEDIQKTLDDLRAEVETLKARLSQQGKNLDDHTHLHCFHGPDWKDQRCCWCSRSSQIPAWKACLAHPTGSHGQPPALIQEPVNE